jgi:hypothetical protein
VPTNLDRLKEESANPFRTFRLFLYGASGASALIGGLTSCAQLVGTLGDAPQALPLATVVTNLGVDFGVVAAAVALYRFENGERDAELADAVRSDVLKKAPRVSKAAMAQREAVLKDLPLTITLDVAGETKRATVNKALCPVAPKLTKAARLFALSLSFSLSLSLWVKTCSMQVRQTYEHNMRLVLTVSGVGAAGRCAAARSGGGRPEGHGQGKLDAGQSHGLKGEQARKTIHRCDQIHRLHLASR